MLSTHDADPAFGVYGDVKVALHENQTLRLAIEPGLGYYQSNPYVDADAHTGEEPTRTGTAAIAAPLIVDWKLGESLALTTAPTVHAAVMEATTESGPNETDLGVGVGAHVALAIDLGDMVSLHPECSILHGFAGDSEPGRFARVLHPGATLIEFGISVNLTGLNSD